MVIVLLRVTIIKLFYERNVSIKIWYPNSTQTNVPNYNFIICKLKNLKIGDVVKISLTGKNSRGYFTIGDVEKNIGLLAFATI